METNSWISQMAEAELDRCLVSVVLNNDGGKGHNLPYARALGEVAGLLGLKHKVLLPTSTRLAPLPLNWFPVLHSPEAGTEHISRLSKLRGLRRLYVSLHDAFAAECPHMPALAVIDSFSVAKLLCTVFALWERPHIKTVVIHRYDYGTGYEKWGYALVDRIGCWLLGAERFCLVTDSVALSTYLSALFRRQVAMIPIPHTFPSRTRKGGPTAAMICWHPGQALVTKGLERIRKLATETTPAARQLIIWVAEGVEISSHPAGPTVERVPLGLPAADYEERMDRCDVVILPYLASSYGRRTSGVFIEAVVAGKVPLVAAGTWMAAELQATDLTECILDWHSENVAAAILAAANSEQVRRKLSVLAGRYRRYHSPAGYAEAIGHLVPAMTPLKPPGKFKETKLYQALRNNGIELLHLAVAIMDRLVPKNDSLLIAAFPDIEDQTVAILRALQKSTRFRSIVILSGENVDFAERRLERIVGEDLRVKIVPKMSVAGVFEYLRAKHIVFTHGVYESAWGRSRAKKTINVWHGIPLKGIWKANRRPGVVDNTPNADALVATSAMTARQMQSISTCPWQDVLPLGLPRNDLLAAPSPQAARLREHLGYARLVVMLPTFRLTRGRRLTLDGIEGSNVLMATQREIEDMQALLASQDTLLLVKPHPMSIHHGHEGKLRESIWQISDRWLGDHGVSLYDFLSVSDALVTDISSVYVDYLVTRKPIFFYFPDFDEYKRARGFSLQPIEEFLPAEVCISLSEIVRVMDGWLKSGDTNHSRRDAIATMLNPQRRAGAADAVITLFEEVKK